MIHKLQNIGEEFDELLIKSTTRKGHIFRTITLPDLPGSSALPPADAGDETIVAVGSAGVNSRSG